MASISITQNRLRYSKGSTSPSTTGAAYQGYQGGTTTSYRFSGDMRFTSPALGAGVNITGASITLTADAIGADSTKNIGLHWNSATGSPSQSTAVASFYNTTATITFNDTMLASIASAAKTSGNITIGLYQASTNNYSTSLNYDYNYCKVTQAVLNIYYNYSGTVNYYTGTEWKQCIPYYYDGTSWKECKAYYYTGSEWKAGW